MNSKLLVWLIKSVKYNYYKTFVQPKYLELEIEEITLS